jgi:hypothetical protein
MQVKDVKIHTLWRTTFEQCELISRGPLDCRLRLWIKGVLSSTKRCSIGRKRRAGPPSSELNGPASGDEAIGKHAMFDDDHVWQRRSPYSDHPGGDEGIVDIPASATTLAVKTMSSFAPRMAIRNQPIRSVRCHFYEHLESPGLVSRSGRRPDSVPLNRQHLLVRVIDL